MMWLMVCVAVLVTAAGAGAWVLCVRRQAAGMARVVSFATLGAGVVLMVVSQVLSGGFAPVELFAALVPVVVGAALLWTGSRSMADRSLSAQHRAALSAAGARQLVGGVTSNLGELWVSQSQAMYLVAAFEDEDRSALTMWAKMAADAQETAEGDEPLRLVAVVDGFSGRRRDELDTGAVWLTSARDLPQVLSGSRRKPGAKTGRKRKR